MTIHPVTEVRNLSFDLANVPRFWLGERKSVTAFLNNLSIFFPAGERFFITSVRAYREQIKDPKLAEDMRTFYAQEGIHTREHVRYNEMLAMQGYPIEEMDARVEKLLSVVRRILPDRFQLGVTCALEHFTALMADWLLKDPKVLEGADPHMAALWRWHAAEENEHKAVAFEVFQAVGGTFIERAVIMIVATIIFWAKVLEHQVRLMRVDKTLWSLSEWRALYSFLFKKPGGMERLIPAYIAYFSPKFHPWNHDNRALLESWKAEVKTAPIYLASLVTARGKRGKVGPAEAAE